jgi:DNA-binding CsgD family transcriptional regulator
LHTMSKSPEMGLGTGIQVMHVSLSMLRRALCLLDELHDADPADAPRVLLPGLAGLVGCDLVSYNEATADNRLSYSVAYPADAHAALRPVLEAHLHEHPVLAHFRTKNDWEPAKISDFLSRQQFHRTGLYAEFYRPLPTEDQMSFLLPTLRDDLYAGISFNRVSRDFTEADRDLLKAIAAPVGNAIQRRRSHEAANSGTAMLTERERQVLQLAAQGRTSLAIAHRIDVSPRTVAKHLENVYRKLGVANRAAAVSIFTRSH